MRFQDGCETDLESNKLTVVAVDMIPITEESKVTKISTKPEESVDLEKGYFHFLHVFLVFNREEDVDRN